MFDMNISWITWILVLHSIELLPKALKEDLILSWGQDHDPVKILQETEVEFNAILAL